MTTLTIDSAGGAVELDGAPIDIHALFNAMGRYAHVETGLIPPGLLSFRQAGGLTQIATQVPPRVHTFSWVSSEGDPDEFWSLAMPWRIALGTYDSTHRLIGARIFYSPTMITSFDDLLYHTNLPNTNTRGYGYPESYSGQQLNTIGWVCLYGDEGRPVSAADKARHLNDIVSGGGSYNDGNMSGTDGTRLYQKMLADRPYMWDRVKWQAKTDKEGTSWICDPDNLIVVKVEGHNSQTKHVEGGVPLTLGAALFGTTRWHYEEPDTWIKPYNLTDAPSDPGHELVRTIKKFMADVAAGTPFPHDLHGLNIEAIRADVRVPDKAEKVEAKPEVKVAKKAPAAKVPAKKVPAKKKAVAKKAPAKKAPAKKAAAFTPNAESI